MKADTLGMIIIGLAAGLLYLLAPILMPFVVAMILAYLLSPIVTKLEAHMPRTVASLLPIILAMVGLVGAVAIVVPFVADDIARFVQKVPSYIAYAEGLLQESNGIEGILASLPFDVDITALKEKALTHAGSAAKVALETVKTTALGAMAIVDVFSLLLITPLVIFYMLNDWHKVKNGIASIIPTDIRSESCTLFKKVDEALSAFIRGQMMVCLILGMFYGIALSAVGLQMGFFIGFMTGLLSFIPFVGLALGAVVAFVVAVLQFHFDSTTPYILIAVIFAIGQVLEGFILTPKLVGEKVGLHPVWVIFAIMAGGELGGFVGMLIALPVMTILSVIVPELFKHWFQKREAARTTNT